MVGEVDVKVALAGDAGFTEFLLPVGNADEPKVQEAAREAGIRLVPVGSVDEAIVFLCGQPGVDDAVCR